MTAIACSSVDQCVKIMLCECGVFCPSVTQLDGKNVCCICRNDITELERERLIVQHIISDKFCECYCAKTKNYPQ